MGYVTTGLARLSIGAIIGTSISCGVVVLLILVVVTSVVFLKRKSSNKYLDS